MRFNRLLGLTCAVSVLALACGKSTSTPTGPTATPTTIVNTYIAELSLPGGVTGTLTLRASSSLASRQPGDIPVLARLLGWVEPAVAAQSSTATGLLVTSNGDIISLTGTFSNGTFSISGGGYSIVATVASTSTSTSISGTATVPGGGSAPVTPPPPLPVTEPPPANPVGTYTGTFHIETTMTSENRRVSDNGLELNCIFGVTTNGTLSLRIFNVLPSGLVQSELTSSWTEGRVPLTCKLGSVLLSAIPPSVSAENVSSPSAGLAYFEGPASSLVFGHSGQGTNANGNGVITGAEGYVGAVSGNAVVMKVSRSYRFVSSFTSSTAGPINGAEWYPTASATTTLIKQ